MVSDKLCSVGSNQYLSPQVLVLLYIEKNRWLLIGYDMIYDTLHDMAMRACDAAVPTLQKYIAPKK